MAQEDSDGFFGGGPKNPAALRFYPGEQIKFRPPDIGYKTGGQILSITVSQQRDYETGNLKFWPDGNKMLQAAVILQTDERTGQIDANGDLDDGRRTLYVYGQMKQAISEAVREAGDRSGNPKPGGHIVVWCLNTFDAVKQKKKNTWAASYRQGSLPQESQEFFNGQQQAPQQQAQQQYAQPQQQQYAQQQPQQYANTQQRATPAQQQYAQQYAQQAAPRTSMLDTIKQNMAAQEEEPPF